MLKSLLAAAVCSCILLFAAGPPGQWLDVPFVKQEKNGCGAASIAMVMQYWQLQSGQPADKNADAEQIQRALYSGPAHGVHASDMTRYLQQHGFRTFAFQGGWDDLKQQLAKGRPLIVALKPAVLKPGAGDMPLHYVVVTGLDWEHKLVLKNDPAERKLLKQEEVDFEREWKATGNWTLLAIPDAIPKENGPPSSRLPSSH
jgi:ABC-type bacteriocin/lantibiotic exporter with double-glycine peptidase domain